MRSNRPSTTSTWVAALRGLGSVTMPGVADDPLAVSLVPRPYSTMLRWASRHSAPIRRAHEVLLRATDARVGHMTFRTRAIDDAIAHALSSKARPRQLVILGAGLDARAHRLPGLGDVSVFELDHPTTQAFKRRRAASLPLLARALHYVPTNFEADDLAMGLAHAGHDSTAPSVFVWEGVVMYLSTSAIASTLAVLRERAALGSTLAVTYLEPIAWRGWVDGHLLRRLLGSVREPVRTEWRHEDARRHLRAHGFDVVSDESDIEWGPRYLGRSTSRSLERLVVGVRA
ncbi:MAG: class I SAM-dependent methyltransferase [Polyangiales bacterium]